MQHFIVCVMRDGCTSERKKGNRQLRRRPEFSGNVWVFYACVTRVILYCCACWVGVVSKPSCPSWSRRARKTMDKCVYITTTWCEIWREKASWLFWSFFVCVFLTNYCASRRATNGMIACVSMRRQGNQEWEEMALFMICLVQEDMFRFSTGPFIWWLDKYFSCKL